jgi:hypothetical protein
MFHRDSFPPLPFIILFGMYYDSFPTLPFIILFGMLFSQVVTDMNGKEKKNKKLGGAYPGQRRPQHQQYTPPASDFGKDGQATAHFVAYGGGNALVLVKKDGSSQPESGGGVGDKPQYIQGTFMHMLSCYFL